jgi:hypothetical protein
MLSRMTSLWIREEARYRRLAEPVRNITAPLEQAHRFRE